MPNTITGLVRGAARGSVWIQAFDRDLPSLELRLGAQPRLLGEAVADAEGRFEIAYAPEEFVGAEALTTLRGPREATVDVSFRAFDRARQELPIRGIRALEREYRPEQIIFNAPARLQVEITIDRERREGASEYEQLVAMLGPVIGDVPGSGLTDDDIAFLSDELELEEDREGRQRLEWWRRSALLSAQTNLPPEVFYGWGRQDLPGPLANLVEQPLNELPIILDKLSNTTGDALRAGLLAAIEANTIPALFRDSVDALVAAVRRRNQRRVTLRLRLEAAATGRPLSGHSVSTVDIERENADLGSDVTDSQGEFDVAFFDDGQSERGERNLRFSIRSAAADEPLQVTQRVRPIDDVIVVQVALAASDPTLRDLQQSVRLQIPPTFLDALENTHGIRSLADIRRRGGLQRIAALRNVDQANARRLDALADLDRLCDSVTEAATLLGREYQSVLSIADTSRADFIAAIANDDTGISRQRAAQLHIAAKAQTDLLDQLFMGVAVSIAAGVRPPLGGEPPDYMPPLPQEQDHV